MSHLRTLHAAVVSLAALLCAQCTPSPAAPGRAPAPSAPAPASPDARQPSGPADGSAPTAGGGTAAVPPPGDGAPASSAPPAVGTASAAAPPSGGGPAASSLRWEPTDNGSIPAGAVVAGQVRGGGLLYVCRAHHGDGVHPGRVVGSSCNIGHGGREIAVPSFEILTTSEPLPPQSLVIHWESVASGRLPAGVVHGGQEDGRSLHVCRARHRGGMHPGRVVGANCHIGYGGREVVLRDYQAMTLVPVRAPSRPTGAGVCGDHDRSDPVNVLSGRIVGDMLSLDLQYTGGCVAHDVELCGGGGWQESLPPQTMAMVRHDAHGDRCTTVVSETRLFDLATIRRQYDLPAGETQGIFTLHVADLSLDYRFDVAAPAPAGSPPPSPADSTPYSGLPAYSALQWVSAANGSIPPGAVGAGWEPRAGRMYVCRALHRGGLHPGKVVGSNCNVGYGGGEVSVPHYEILTTPQPERIQWVHQPTSGFPEGVVAGGQESGRIFYVCRAIHRGGVHIGRVFSLPSVPPCRIGYGGREIAIQDYQLMTLVPDGRLADQAALCGTPPPTDPASLDAVTVRGGRITGDILSLDLRYLGGCGLHDFALCHGGGGRDPATGPTSVWVGHDRRNDSCAAAVSKTRLFDLTAIRREYQRRHPGSGTMALRIGGRTFRYRFTE